MPTPLEQWVEETAAHTKPKRIHWCDGSEQENQRLIEEMIESGTLLELNRKRYPDCYLHRSDPNDVARTEHLTFVNTAKQEDAGPNNNWMPPGPGQRNRRRPVCRLNERPHNVCGALHHGPASLALQPAGGGNHR